MFPRAKVSSVECVASDHLPIHVNLYGVISKRKAHRFKFENLWIHEDDCGSVVEESWNVFSRNGIKGKIDNVGNVLEKWGRDKALKFHRRIKDLKAKVSCLRWRRDPNGVLAFNDAAKELSHVQEQERVYWRQRAKNFWYKAGDSNTRFFHNYASSRRKRNAISKLKNDDGVWCEWGNGLESHILSYFQTLFKSSVDYDDRILRLIAGNRFDNIDCLTENVSEAEVKRAVFNMQGDKAPGMDGLTPAFYQSYWSIVKADLIVAVNDFLNNGNAYEGMNDTAITLIPKKKNPISMGELRPISLCNVFYKIVSKILANRMKVIMPSIISESQSAFVSDRLISDNVMLAYEAMHCLKRKSQGKEGFAALKIDMSKAYDRVEWVFLQNMLRAFGFGEKFVQIIWNCISTVRYFVVHDGNEVGPIVPSRGLRQGDPLSPYLFILCAEGLSLMLQEKERLGLIHGLKICRRAPAISHLFFADDCLLFFKANAKQADQIKEVLMIYEQSSGQMVNFNKSSIFFSKNVDSNCKENIKTCLGVGDMQLDGSYLGLPFMIGRNKAAVFGMLKNRVWDRIQSWKHHFLSAAGKEMLIKTVLQSIPSYYFNVFLIPTNICSDIEIMLNSFWWGSKKNKESRGINWSNWDKLCSPKKFGGMGFRKLKDFNLAMLGKQGWRFLNAPNSLVSRVFRAKYFHDSDFLSAKLGSNPSYVWRSVMAAHEIVRKGTRWRIGSGNTIRIGIDRWLPDSESGLVQSVLSDDVRNAYVDSLMVVENGCRQWDNAKLETLFSNEDRHLIYQIILSNRSLEDKLIWLPEVKGGFSVKSAYRLSVGDANTTSVGEDRFWKWLWHCNIPGKCKIFLWRAMRNWLPTRDALRAKRCDVSNLCLLCDSDLESVPHLFVNCAFITRCWQGIGVRANMQMWQSLLEFLNWSFSGKSEDSKHLIVMVLWSVWYARNNLLWNGIKEQPKQVINRAGCVLHQWKMVQKLPTSLVINNEFGGGAASWEKPKDGWTKVNVDAACFQNAPYTGFAVVERDAMGCWVEAISDSKVDKLPPVVAEAWALKEALSWIKERSKSNVVIEVDCLQLVQWLYSDIQPTTYLLCLVCDCIDILKTLLNVKVHFVYRSANFVAHTLARTTNSMSGRRVWSNGTPSFLDDVMFADLN